MRTSENKIRVVNTTSLSPDFKCKIITISLRTKNTRKHPSSSVRRLTILGKSGHLYDVDATSLYDECFLVLCNVCTESFTQNSVSPSKTRLPLLQWMKSRLRVETVRRTFTIPWNCYSRTTLFICQFMCYIRQERQNDADARYLARTEELF